MTHSTHPKDHPLHSTANKEVLGKMDKRVVHLVAEYLGLRPKMYSIFKADGKKHQECQRREKKVVKKHVCYGQYIETSLSKWTFRHGMDVLRSERPRIYGEHLNKASFSPFESKR